MESEIGVQKPKGMMKSKLVMYFYRAAKPCSPPPLQYGGDGDHKGTAAAAKAKSSHSNSHSHSHSPAEAAAAASSSTQKVMSFNKQRSFGGSDGYVHGPDGGAGDRSVDNKASSYISYVKERRLLEELLATHGFIDNTNK